MEDQNTKVLSVIKERDFYHAKTIELKQYVRKDLSMIMQN